MSNTKQPIHPPNSGQDLQYERLLMEELSIKKDRKSILESQSNKSTSANDNTTEAIQSLKIRSMLHRVSLESMLLSAQYSVAAESNKSKNNNNSGMDNNPESTKQNALIALSIFKSNQLEEDDNSLPLVIDSESLEWRKKFTSNIIGGKGDDNSMKEGQAKIEGDADDFFSAFPECKRKEDVSMYQYNEMDESDSDSDDGDDDIVCIEQKKPKAKRKQAKKSSSSGGQPSVVTSCSSSSPSPEKAVQQNLPSNGVVMGSELNNMRSNNVQNHYQQNHNQLPGANNNPYQQQQQQHNRHPSNNNPYHQRHQQQNNRQWQQNAPQHQQQQNGHPQHTQHQAPNAYQQQPAFDYGDSNSFQGDTSTQKKGKANPFRTAKELGPNFNDKNKGGGNNQRNGNDWDNYGGGNNQGNTYNNNNNGQRRGGMNNNNTLPGGTQNPGNMVRAAIRAPKDNISAGLKRKFQPPMKRDANGNNGNNNNSSNNNNRQGSNNSNSNSNNKEEEELPEELKGLDKELIEKINNDIVDSGEQICFDDIAGLQNAKDTVNELVIMPMLRPELFTGLRACPKGLLLFGPPGTGKTLIGKAIAHESGATFFSISSSSLTSKWIGEGEKLVRTLFAVANYRAPSVVFIDEVDSMLTQRKADENEASRRIKTEFLVQLDGAGNGRKGQVLVIGATNLPAELDDAARRRFVKKLYIPLPEQSAREALLRTLLDKNKNSLSDEEITKLSHNTHGFSGADLKALCTDAAMGPLRKLGKKALAVDAADVPPITYKHFKSSLRSMNPSVAEADLAAYIEWNNTYGNTCTNDDSQDSDDSESTSS